MLRKKRENEDTVGGGKESNNVDIFGLCCFSLSFSLSLWSSDFYSIFYCFNIWRITNDGQAVDQMSIIIYSTVGACGHSWCAYGRIQIVESVIRALFIFQSGLVVRLCIRSIILSYIQSARCPFLFTLLVGGDQSCCTYWRVASVTSRTCLLFIFSSQDLSI